MDAEDALLLDVDTTKSRCDPKFYRLVRLACGARALLIHDGSCAAAADAGADADAGEGSGDDSSGSSDVGSGEESSADGDSSAGSGSDDGSGSRRGGAKAAGSRHACVCICVRAGSFDDPPGAEGMAHFAEHLLFMGSKRFAAENGFDAFVAAEGGSSNAFTELEYTAYQAEVGAPAALPDTLARMADFLVAPALSPGAVGREVRAIDSEFAQAQSSDDARVQQLMAATATPAHPTARFSWGNSASLGVAPAPASTAAEAAAAAPTAVAGDDAGDADSGGAAVSAADAAAAVERLRAWHRTAYGDPAAWHIVVRANGAALGDRYYTPPQAGGATAAAPSGRGGRGSRGGRGGASRVGGPAAEAAPAADTASAATLDARVAADAALNALESAVTWAFRGVGRAAAGGGGGGAMAGRRKRARGGAKAAASGVAPPAPAVSVSALAAAASGGPLCIITAAEALDLLLPEQLDSQSNAAGGDGGTSGGAPAAAAATAASPSLARSAGHHAAHRFSPEAAAHAAERLIAPGTTAAAAAAATAVVSKLPPRFRYAPAATSAGGPLRPLVFLIVPREDTHTLQLSWPLPPLGRWYRSRPEETLGHLLGHEATGSILASLKASGWATALDAGCSRESGFECSAAGGAMLTVSVALTTAGIARWRDVVTVIRAYIIDVMCGGGTEVRRAAAAGGDASGAPSPPPATTTARFPLRVGGVRLAGGAALLPAALLDELHAHAAGPLAWVHTEMASIARLRYHHGDDGEESLEAITRLAVGLVTGASDAHAVDGPWLLAPHAPAATALLLGHLLLAGAPRIDIMSGAAAQYLVAAGRVGGSGAPTDDGAGATTAPGAAPSPPPHPPLLLPGEAAQVEVGEEQWFGIAYATAPVDAATVSGAWAAPPPATDLALPLRNAFVPTSLDVWPLATAPVDARGVLPASAAIAAAIAAARGAGADAGSPPAAPPAPAGGTGRGGGSGGGAGGRGAATSPDAAHMPPSPPPRQAPAVELRTDAWALTDANAPDGGGGGGGPALVGRLWWTQDALFRVPRTIVHVRVHTPCVYAPWTDGGATATAARTPAVAAPPPPADAAARGAPQPSPAYARASAAAVLADLTCQLTTEAIADAAYYADAAESTVSVSQTWPRGVEVSIEGFSQPLPALLVAALDALTAAPVVAAPASTPAAGPPAPAAAAAAAASTAGGAIDARTAARVAEALTRFMANALHRLDEHIDIQRFLALWAGPPGTAPVTFDTRTAALAALGGSDPDGHRILAAWRQFTGRKSPAADSAADAAAPAPLQPPQPPPCPPLFWSAPGQPVIVEVAVHGNETAASAAALYDAVIARVSAVVRTAATRGDSSVGSAPPQLVRLAVTSDAAIAPLYGPVFIRRLPPPPTRQALISMPVPSVVVTEPSVSPLQRRSAVCVYVQAVEDVWEPTGRGAGGGGGPPQPPLLPLRRARLELLEELMAESAFNELRTRQQLGYTVAVRIVRDAPMMGDAPLTGATPGGDAPGCSYTLGVTILVESSSHGVDDVQQRVLAWLGGFRAQLATMVLGAPAAAPAEVTGGAATAAPSGGRAVRGGAGRAAPSTAAAPATTSAPAAPPVLARYVASLVATKLAPDAHLSEAASRDWDEVRWRRREFGCAAAEASALRATTGADVLALWDAAFSPGAARVAVFRIVGRGGDGAVGAAT